MARIIKPPVPIQLQPGEKSLFLAGSIEGGKAERWQTVVEDAFAHDDLTILNPRRDAWDETWAETFESPHFREQVEWELAGLETASLVAFYFAPATKAPITLLELGLTARSGRAVVCCPPDYWRRGNVEVVCHRHGIPLVESLGDLVKLIRARLV